MSSSSLRFWRADSTAAALNWSSRFPWHVLRPHQMLLNGMNLLLLLLLLLRCLGRLRGLKDKRLVLQVRQLGQLVR